VGNGMEPCIQYVLPQPFIHIVVQTVFFPHQSDLATLCVDVSFPACSLGWVLDGRWLFRNWLNFEASVQFQGCPVKVPGCHMQPTFSFGLLKKLIFLYN